MSGNHRHSMQADPARSNGLVHEHEFEPVRGLPEELPAGERIVWQGSPDWRAMARRAFHVRKLAVYFAALAVLRVLVLISNDASAREMFIGAVWMLFLGVAAVGVMSLMAWLSARAAVYTITDRRVVMRIGIVLTLTFNIPFKRIEAAGLNVAPDGTGDIPLSLSGDDRIAWLNLWPHARPWRVNKPEPMLRNVPQAAEVARQLAQAWSRQTGVAPAAQAMQPTPQGRSDPAAGQPALAGR